MLGKIIACLQTLMAETNDRFFLDPRKLLSASEIDFLDAINLVVYATLPLKTSFHGSALIAGYICRDEGGHIKRTNWLPGKEDLIRKYAAHIDCLSYPVAPSHYERLLDKMCSAKESVLPYFYHEHHLMVDRRRRAAMFAGLYKKKQEEVAKKNARPETPESEKKSTIPLGTSITGAELQSYLRTEGVLPWWKDDKNLASHTHLERVLLSDSLSLPPAKSQDSETDEMQCLPDLPISTRWTSPAREPQKFGLINSGMSQASQASELESMARSEPVSQGLIQRVLRFLTAGRDPQEIKLQSKSEGRDKREPLATELSRSQTLLPTTPDNRHHGMETKGPATFVQVRQLNHHTPEHESYDNTQIPSLLLAEKLLKQSLFAGINRQLLQGFVPHHHALPSYDWTGYSTQNQVLPIDAPPVVATSIRVDVISDNEYVGLADRDDIPAPASKEQDIALNGYAVAIKNRTQPEDSVSAETAPPDVTDSKNLSKREVGDLLAVSENTVDNYRKKFPDFPEPFFLGVSTLRWKRSEIQQWMDSRPRIRS